MTHEEHRIAVLSYRDEVIEAKDHLKLKLWKNVKGNDKGDYEYVNSQTLARENMYLLLNGQRL